MSPRSSVRGTPQPDDATEDGLDPVAAAAVDDERPAAPSSPLAGLRARREAARAAMYLDVKVPGLEGVFVRFRAMTPPESTRLTNRHEKAKDEERQLRINSAVLATCCLGVYDTVTDDDGKPRAVSIDERDPEGPPPKFDRRLADLIGMTWHDDETRAADVVREFYLEPMHVLSVGDEVSIWSTARDQDLRRTEQGN